MTNRTDRHSRAMLPIPDRPAPDPHDVRRQGSRHRFLADRAAVSAGGSAQRADRAARRRRVRCIVDVRWTSEHAHGRSPGGGRAAVQPVPHHRAVRADTAGDADRPEPSLGGDGFDHRNGDVGAGQQFGAAEHQGTAGDDDEAQRLLDRTVRQVPRGAGVAVVADRAVRCVAVGWRRIRDVLRVHRWREQPVGTSPVRRVHARRTAGDPRGGLSPHRRPRRSVRGLDQTAEGPRPGTAVLHLLRTRRDARPASLPGGMDREVQGPVRRRMGCAARGDLRTAEGDGRHSRRRRAPTPARRDLVVGRHARRDEAGPEPTDGGLRRVPRTHRSPRRTDHRRHRRHRRARQHVDLLHHRRQRRVRRGHDERRVQRDGQLQRHGRARDARVHAVQDRRLRVA